MEFRTIVDVPRPGFLIEPQERILFVGSCFADSIGRRFAEEKFRATVNPYGVMYNPASILHTVERTDCAPRVAFFTLGTNHVYILNETGEIVDNCRKRPQKLFTERELSVDECIGYLRQAVDVLARRNPEVDVVLTVSPIRYAKYGYHGSQLSKAALLMAADWMARMYRRCTYFPAYEIVLDELRGYVANVRLGKPESAGDCLRPILSSERIFGTDLYKAGLAGKVEEYFKRLLAGPGAVRHTLEEETSAPSYIPAEIA